MLIQNSVQINVLDNGYIKAAHNLVGLKQHITILLNLLNLNKLILIFIRNYANMLLVTISGLIHKKLIMILVPLKYKQVI